MKDNCEGDEFTHNFSVRDHKIIAKEGDVVNGDKKYFGSDTKDNQKSYLQLELEFHNEEEDKVTLLGCEPENLVEEKATIVSLHEEDNIKHKYYKIFNFCISHVYLHPPDPWEDEKTSLAYEGCKMKDSCERDEFTSSFLLVIANYCKGE